MFIMSNFEEDMQVEEVGFQSPLEEIEDYLSHSVNVDVLDGDHKKLETFGKKRKKTPHRTFQTLIMLKMMICKIKLIS